MNIRAFSRPKGAEGSVTLLKGQAKTKNTVKATKKAAKTNEPDVQTASTTELKSITDIKVSEQQK